jgi:uncharacterized protein (DUF488 family)
VVFALMIRTIGHSTRSFSTFVELLRDSEISELIDVRTIPRSRRHPHFNRETLSASLRDFGIGYAHMPGLGGLRHARPDSINTGWRNASFRGYADYMQTPTFEQNLAMLIEHARRGQVAIMCAEAVPWRCHRSLIADALVAREVTVEHIVGLGRREPHRMTSFARLDGTRVTYPGPGPEQLSSA